MIQLYDKATGAALGTISEEQLQFLIAQLEEETSDDTDYYINRDTLELFASQGGDPALLEQLRQALGSRDDMELRWSRT